MPPAAFLEKGERKKRERKREKGEREKKREMLEGTDIS